MGRGSGRFDPIALRAAREAAGLTRAMLAELAEATTRQIAAYESGRVPEPARMTKLASALGLRATDLMGGEPDSLADLRRAAGFTAAQTAERLSMSRNTYRKLEQDGVLPAGSSLINDLANVFGFDANVIRHAILANPSAVERQQRARKILDRLAGAAVGPKGGDLEIKRSDPDLKIVSDAIGYHVDVVRPALTAALRDIHAAARAVVAAEEVARWEGGNPQAEAWPQNQALQRQRDGLFDNLRTTLQGLIPRAEWALLVSLTRGDQDNIFQTIRANMQATRTLERWGFIEARLPNAEELARGRSTLGIVVTPRAVDYIKRYADRHRRVHPDITRHLPRRPSDTA